MGFSLEKTVFIDLVLLGDERVGPCDPSISDMIFCHALDDLRSQVAVEDEVSGETDGLIIEG